MHKFTEEPYLDLNGEEKIRLVPTPEHKEHMRKLQRMFGQIDALLADKDMIDRIGSKCYDDFMGQFSEGMMWNSEEKEATVYGHSLEVVRYYCDTFNHPARKKLTDEEFYNDWK